MVYLYRSTHVQLRLHDLKHLGTMNQAQKDKGTVGQRHNHATVFVPINKGGGDQLPLQTAATTENVIQKMGILDLGGIHRLNTDDISLQTSHPRSRTPVQRGLGRGRLPTLTTESPPPWGPFPPRPNRRHGGMSAGPL